MSNLDQLIEEDDRQYFIREVNSSIKSVEADIAGIEDIIDSTVHDYSKDLDSIMDKVYNEVISVEYPAINTIEKCFLELSNCLYMMCERSEKLGLYDSISKAKAQNTYNMKYLQHQQSNIGTIGAKKPTVAESQAVSEEAALYDKTVNDLYNKSYKIIKSKVAAAETMVGALSKILSHRMQESQLTFNQTGRQILNEEAVF